MLFIPEEACSSRCDALAKDVALIPADLGRRRRAGVSGGRGEGGQKGGREGGQE